MMYSPHLSFSACVSLIVPLARLPLSHPPPTHTHRRSTKPFLFVWNMIVPGVCVLWWCCHLVCNCGQLLLPRAGCDLISLKVQTVLSHIPSHILCLSLYHCVQVPPPSAACLCLGLTGEGCMKGLCMGCCCQQPCNGIRV